MTTTSDPGSRAHRSGHDPAGTALTRFVVSLLLAAATFAGFWLRVHHLHLESLWYDEIVSVRCLNAPGLFDYLRRLRAVDPPMMPLYFVAQYVWTSAFGPGVVALRMLSVMSGTLVVPLSFLVGRRLYGAFAGLAAATCAALSPVGVYYSQEIRMYSLFAVLVLFSVYTFLRVLEQDSLVNWLAHGAASLLLVWTHLLAPLFLAPMALTLLVFRRSQRGLVLRWLGLQACVGVTMLIWLATVDRAAVRAAASWIDAPGPGPVFLAFLGYAGRAWVPTSNPWFPFIDTTRLTAKFAVMSLVLVAVLVLGSRLLVARRCQHPATRDSHGASPSEALALLLFWAVLPPCVLVLVSHLGLPCFVARYAMPSSLAFCVLYGGASAELRPGWRRALFIACVTAVLVSQQAATILTPGPLRADYASAAAHIARQGRPTEEVIVAEWHHGESFSHHIATQNGSQTVRHTDLDAHPRRVLDTDAATFWVVLETPPRRAALMERFESALTDGGLGYQKTLFPGNCPLAMYHVKP